ncbi:hypothetical protein [Nocardia concava]|uniref:hypothetical protein n=1 Tax=Nocardia concava TaxID=257281 RepID=UPI0012F83B99|nr:hypothetical protein [Nocardia concava]
MRTLIFIGVAASTLLVGVGPAAAAPLPLTDVTGVPAATGTAGSDGGLTGSASNSAQGTSTLWCMLTHPPCLGESGHLG